MFNFGVGGWGVDFQLFKWSQKDRCQTKPLKKTESGETPTISASLELLVFYSCRVIYFKNVEDKGKIYPFGMSKEGSGTDTQFITAALIEVRRDEERDWSTASPQLLQTRTTTEQARLIPQAAWRNARDPCNRLFRVNTCRWLTCWR